MAAYRFCSQFYRVGAGMTPCMGHVNNENNPMRNKELATVTQAHYSQKLLSKVVQAINIRA